ncbi:peptidoglycan DD-metalloendopeptidase family protein [Glutamicibacter sp. TV12E]|uniref:aggregation-promoting factor C-terminal-like domain-containing protein n=1 Tax=Glutamicibacter sp. TV12E TaxID=3446362 RepID=UPI004034CF87
MAFNAGNAFVTVTPRFIAFHSYVRKEMNSVMPAEGRAAGNVFGRAMTQGAQAGINSELPALKRAAEAAGKTVQTAAEKAVKARDSAADAAGKLRVAEEKLNQVRASTKATPDQLAAAEERVASAQRRVQQTSYAAETAQKNYVGAMKTSTAAHETLQKATEESERATKEAANASSDASKKYASGWRGVGQRIKGFVKTGVKNAVGSATKEAEAGGRRAGGGFSSAFKTAAGALAIGLSVSEAFQFGKESIDLAGAAEQSVGAIDTVFKETAKTMHDFAAQAKDTVALSANEYRELGTLLGSQLKNMGTPMDALADKTDGLIRMGADMSSMFGGTTKEAIEAISSALKGEMDPIERYGVTLSAAALEAEALSKNIIKPVVDSEKVQTAATKMTLAQSKYNATVKKFGKDSDEAKRAQLALTSAENAYEKATAGKVPQMDSESKALAVQSALYAQSADAQGNFMRESDTFQQKREKAIASWQDLKVTLGKAFLPAMTQVFGYIGGTAIPALETFAGWVKENQSWLKPLSIALLSTVGTMMAFRAVIPIIFGITRAVALFKGGFAALNIVMKANVFGLIVSAIAGLVAGFIYLWNTNEGFRNFFIGAWDAIKNAVSAAVSWISSALETMGTFFSGVWASIESGVGTALGVIQEMASGVASFFSSVWTGIQTAVGTAVGFIQGLVADVVSFFTGTVAPMFVWFYQNVILPVWNGIKTAIAVALLPTVLLIRGLVWVFQNVLAPAMTWLYQNVVVPVWNGIKTAISAVVLAVKTSIDAWVYLCRNVLAPATQWLYLNVIVPVWNGIKTVISTVWNAVKFVFLAIVNFVRSTLSTAFTWLRDSVIVPVWNGIKTAISAVWTAVKITFWAIVNFVRTTLSNAFTWLRDSVIKPVWNGIKIAISTVWTGIKAVFWAIVNFVRSTLTNAFTWLRDSVIKPVWNGIKSAISSVWEKGIKPIFEALGNFIRDKVAPVFQKGIDSVKAIWDTLKDIAKAPVKFMVDTVINKGLIDSFNKVADFIKIGKLDHVKLPEGFAEGGWTGPGHKYQEAGIVHADEFVVKKSSRRRIERRAPGFLDSLNQFGDKALGYANGGLVRPLRGGRVSSGFGASRGRYPHAGQDFATPVGTPIYAAMDGTVLKAGWNAITGRTGIGAFLGHEGGRNTYYGHLSRLLVQVGDMVKQGQKIALSGNTGRSTGPHLHFETWTGGKPVNPAPFLGGAALPEGAEGGGGWNPIQSLLDVGGKIKGWFSEKFPEGGKFLDAAVGFGSKVFTDLKDWAWSKLAAIGDFAQDTWSNVKGFFTGGKSKAKEAVQGVAGQYGWGSGDQWDALQSIIQKESSWKVNAANSSSSARGLFQKMTSIHGPIESTAEGQAKWGLNYIKQRYGNPMNAWSYWQKHHSYADGGQVKPIQAFAKGGLARGLSLVGEEGPELVNFSSTARISTASMTEKILSDTGLQAQLAAISGNRSSYVDAILKSIEASRATTGPGNQPGTYIGNVQLPPGATVSDLTREIRFADRVNRRGGVRR